MNKLKAAFKDWNRWAHAFPWKAVLFAVFFTLVACVMAGINETGVRYFLILFVLGMVALFAIVFKDLKKLPLVLCFCVLTSSVRAAEPPQQLGPVGITVGVTVICIGGICVYKLYKFCQRKFPKSPSTNSPPASVVGDGDEWGASWNYGSLGTCDPTLTEEGPDFVALDAPATLFVIDISPAGTVTTTALHGDVTQSWTDFQAEVASHGLTITGSSDGSQYFSLNRVPCNVGDVPIAFDELTKTVAIGEGTRLITIERSRDLLSWSPFLVTRVASGSRGLRIEDATVSASMFYRVSISDVP